MFKDLLNLSLKRTRMQALGFYLAYLIVLTLFFYLINNLLLVIFPHTNLLEVSVFEQIGTSMVLTFLVLLAKNMMGLSTGERRYTTFLFYTLFLIAGGVLIGGVFRGFGGFVFGLLPAAYLTTYPKLSKSKNFWI